MNENDELISQLRENWVLNAYILRGLYLNLPGFSYRLIKGPETNEMQLAVIWHEDQGMTLRCSQEWVPKLFRELRQEHPDYVWFDLDAERVEPYLKAKALKLGSLSPTYYHAMTWGPGLEELKTSMDVKELDEDQWNRIRWEYEASYHKELHADNQEVMKSYGYFVKDRCVAVACIEIIEENRRFLSNVFVIPSSRGIGIAEKMITHLMAVHRDMQLGLYVATHNHGAVRLYEKLGFQKEALTVCIE